MNALILVEPKGRVSGVYGEGCGGDWRGQDARDLFRSQGLGRISQMIDQAITTGSAICGAAVAGVEHHCHAQRVASGEIVITILPRVSRVQ